MNDEDYLGGALTDALRDLVGDVQPSDRLRDWVRSELRSEPTPPPLSRRRRWRALAALAPTCAIAAVLTVVLGTQAAPSFAVARVDNGSIRITLIDITGVQGANAKLRQLGITSVAVVPVQSKCKSRIQLLFTGVGAAQHGASVTVAPNRVPPRMTDVLAAAQRSPGIIALGLGRVRGAAPSCVAPPRSGIGLPETRHPRD